MKIPEFAKILEESFQLFFGNRVGTDLGFAGEGEFVVSGYLEKETWWSLSNEKVFLYDIKINLINDYHPTPEVTYIEFPLLGETSEFRGTLEESIVYIKEHLATVKSKAIYENF